MPGCCSHSGCIRRKNRTVKETKNRSDEGRCLYRPVTRLTHSAWLVNRSLPVLDAGVPLRDVQEAASHADPRTTMRYDRARGSLDRHATYIVAAYVAGAAR